MKVVMTADTVGGVWTYTVDLVEALACSGVRVTLFTAGGPLDSDKRRQVETLPLDDLVETTLPLEWMAEPWEGVAEKTRQLADLVGTVKPDLVHLSWFAGAADLSAVAPTVLVAHSDVFTWWEAVVGRQPDESDHPGIGRYRQLLVDGLTGATTVVAPTTAYLTQLRRHLPVPASAVAIPNGRPQHALPVPQCEEPLILCAGRLWDAAKNVAAVTGIADQLPWQVVLAGAGEVPVSSNVKALGRVTDEEMRDWMGRAAVFAAPAKYEPFGLTALEAAAGGCALVLGDIPTLREVWGEAAVFVRDDSVAGALEQLCRDDTTRREMAAAARARAAELTSDQMAQRYLRLYRELLP